VGKGNGGGGVGKGWEREGGGGLLGLYKSEAIPPNQFLKHEAKAKEKKKWGNENAHMLVWCNRSVGR
jgi:hypothetical protein